MGWVARVVPIGIGLAWWAGITVEKHLTLHQSWGRATYEAMPFGMTVMATASIFAMDRARRRGGAGQLPEQGRQLPKD